MQRIAAAAVGRACIVALLTAYGAVGGLDGVAQVTPPADYALSNAVYEFLNVWLVVQDPAGAASKSLSPLLTDERFLPQRPANASDIERQSPQSMTKEYPISPAEFQTRMTPYLRAVARGIGKRKSVDQLLMPFSLSIAGDTDEDLGEILSAQEARPLPKLPALAYQVRTWKDLQWLATGTVAYRALLPDLIRKQQLDVQAVVCRVPAANDAKEPRVLVTIWSGRAAVRDDWKLLGVEVAPAY